MNTMIVAVLCGISIFDAHFFHHTEVYITTA